MTPLVEKVRKVSFHLPPSRARRGREGVRQNRTFHTFDTEGGQR